MSRWPADDRTDSREVPVGSKELGNIQVPRMVGAVTDHVPAVRVSLLCDTRTRDLFILWLFCDLYELAFYHRWDEISRLN